MWGVAKLLARQPIAQPKKTLGLFQFILSTAWRIYAAVAIWRLRRERNHMNIIKKLCTFSFVYYVRNPAPSRTSTWAISWAEKRYLSPSTSPQPQHLAEGLIEHPVRGGLIDWYLDVLGTVPIVKVWIDNGTWYRYTRVHRYCRYILFAGGWEGPFFRAFFEIPLLPTPKDCRVILKRRAALFFEICLEQRCFH